MAYLEFGKGGGHGKRAEREPITGSGHRASSGVHGQSPWLEVKGAKALEAETLFAFECSMEAGNSPIFLKFGNAQNHIYLHCFSKNIECSQLQNVITD